MAAVVFAQAIAAFPLECCLDQYLVSRLAAPETDPLVHHIRAAMAGASMAAFAREYCGCVADGAPAMLQVALYVQGIRHHSSQSRR